jgi:hypothetical protein
MRPFVFEYGIKKRTKFQLDVNKEQNKFGIELDKIHNYKVMGTILYGD